VKCVGAAIVCVFAAGTQCVRGAEQKPIVVQQSPVRTQAPAPTPTQAPKATNAPAPATTPTPAPAAPATPTAKVLPAQLDGTVVAVNPRDRTVTVDVKGKLLTVNVTRQLKITRDGKAVGFEELTAGQTVNLGFVEMANGHIEVASIAIASNPEGLEAAGASANGLANRRTPTLPPSAPFPVPPNPANISAGLVSKHN